MSHISPLMIFFSEKDLLVKKIDPCETPWNISRYEAKLELILTLCFLSVRQSNINLSAFISKSSEWSFAIRRSCVIQPKDFDKSVKRAPNVPPLLMIFLAFSVIAIKGCWVLYFLRKPQWNIDKAFSVRWFIWL